MPKKTPAPLLYIRQPEMKFPKPDMQEIYKISKSHWQKGLNHFDEAPANNSPSEVIQKEAADDSSMQQESLSVKNIDLNQAAIDTVEEADRADDRDELQEIMVKYELERQYTTITPQSSENEQMVSLKRIKGFKEMSMEEKLDYLVDFPKALPPVPCIFSIGNRFIRGYLLSKMNHEIEIKTFDDKQLHISISELKDIQLIGEKQSED